MKIYRVLLFPSGTEIALEINNGLKYAKDIEIYSATSCLDHSEVVYKNYFEKVPYIDDKNFIRDFNEILDNNKIDFVYPAHDSVQLFLVQHLVEIHSQVISSFATTVEICRSKSKTYDFFKNCSFIPETYCSIDEIKSFPVFLKPKIGQGAQGAELITNKELNIQKLNDPKMIVCEYLSGEEFTIDCFSHHNKLEYINIRTRERIKSGIAVRSKRIPLDESVREIANIINHKLEFQGAWFFQLKKNNDGEYKLLEISPRIPGTMGVSRNEGINFPLLTIYTFLNYKLDYLNNNLDIMAERALITRYIVDFSYSKIYIDFDDTILLRNKINIAVMAYLYQLVNKGIKICLITKHADEIYETLKQFKISSVLFDEIIHLKSNQNKSDFIKEKDAIFIDDSFSERMKVKKEKNIPVYDIDMVESLLDWRI